MKVVIKDIPYLHLPQETLQSLEDNETTIVLIRGKVIDLVIDDDGLARKILKKVLRNLQ